MIRVNNIVYCRKLNFLCLLFAEKLPLSIRVLLEAAIRNCDGFYTKEEDVPLSFPLHSLSLIFLSGLRPLQAQG